MVKLLKKIMYLNISKVFITVRLFGIILNNGL